uniref:Uncharacterized protein n=1 Tax=Knipowitschia caucasica TaxID=637954 RepID=A0AAV2LZD7_KNICA
MTSESGEYDMVCQRAVTLIVDLCLHNSSLLESDACQDFIFLLSGHGRQHRQSVAAGARDMPQCVMRGQRWMGSAT